MPLSRFISLVTGGRIVTALPDIAVVDRLEYHPSDAGLLARDGAECQVLPLSTLTPSRNAFRPA